MVKQLLQLLCCSLLKCIWCNLEQESKILFDELLPKACPEISTNDGKRIDVKLLQFLNVCCIAFTVDEVVLVTLFSEFKLTLVNALFPENILSILDSPLTYVTLRKSTSVILLHPESIE